MTISWCTGLSISPRPATPPGNGSPRTRNLASGLGRRATEGVELDVRNEELASEVNITIFTASRLLNEWQRKGMLTKIP
jgi:CRP-like cAMP-binding protein